MPELSQHQQISAKIAELQSQLLAQHPQMPVLLATIHRAIKEDPATVTLLNEEEISVIVKGLEKQTNTYLVNSMTTKSASKTASLKKVTSNDLGFD